MLTGVPDYAWYAGCFGTAGGNLMGYWDRHGFPNFYTGPTAGGIAPLNNLGKNIGICSLWADKAGFDGRPASQPGHIDDYWEYFINEFLYSYQSTTPDPYVLAGRPEHLPDCLGDFIGASQRKWDDFDGECAGNIDAFAFNFWDRNGDRRTNFTPPPGPGIPIRDIQSGVRQWTEFKQYRADVSSQLVDFNPTVPSGRGFSFTDLKREIDDGYPVMIILQRYEELYRDLPGMMRANPAVHAMLAYGYTVTDAGDAVRYRTSWGSGDLSMALWTADPWESQLPVRGVLIYHPLPKITEVRRAGGSLVIKWDGPSSTLTNNITGATLPLHWYVVEKTESILNPKFSAISGPSPDRETTLSACCQGQAFFRVKLLTPEEAGQSR